MSGPVLPLHGVDDLPYHQGLGPHHVPATSDSHYQDGYYFAFYAPGRHVFCGLRLHPNSNVMDGYAGVVDGGEQRDLRVSRALLPDYDTLAVGALRVEVLEPMVRHRVTLADNPTGLAFDVELVASCPPFVEAPHVQYRFGRLHNHVTRYTQPGRATGRMSLDGEHADVDAWFACRDHSWGLRSTMGPHVPIGGRDTGVVDEDRRAMRLWVPFEVDGLAGFFHTHEDDGGRTLDVEGRLHTEDGRALDVAAVEHDLRYEPGTPRLAGGGFTLHDTAGGAHAFSFEVACAPAHPQGFGYTRGWSDGGQPGVYRGVDVAEHDRFDVSDPVRPLGPTHVPEGRRLGGTEFTSTLVGPGGARGMAHVEHMRYGTRRGSTS